MSLMNVYTDVIRPDQLTRYTEGIRALAAAARQAREPMQWTAHQVEFGPVAKMYYLIRYEDHAALERDGDAAALFERVFGSKGAQAFAEVQASVESSERSISTERLDLSYPQEPLGDASPLASIARVRARPGSEGVVEELFVKVAEAVAKTGSSARVLVSQRLTGDMSEYVLARPLQRLADLDSQPVGQDALVAVFGKKEGQRIFRTGLEGVDRIDREIIGLREELSNINNG